MILINDNSSAHHRNTFLCGWAEHDPMYIGEDDYTGEADFCELGGQALEYARRAAGYPCPKLYTLPIHTKGVK